MKTENTDKWLNENFGVLSDEQRGAVLKAQIEEVEKTKRTIAEEREKTLREREASGLYQESKFAAVILTGLVFIGITIGSCITLSNFTNSKVQIAEIQSRTYRTQTNECTSSSSSANPVQSAK